MRGKNDPADDDSDVEWRVWRSTLVENLKRKSFMLTRVRFVLKVSILLASLCLCSSNSLADGSNNPILRRDTNYSPSVNKRISLTAFTGEAIVAYEELDSYDSNGLITKTTEDNSTSNSWSVFPDTKRIFKPLLADQKEAQIRAGFGYDRSGLSFFDLGLGGDLVHAHRLIDSDREIAISVRGLISSRFDAFGKSFALLNTDFFGGLVLDYRSGKSSYELYVFHESSHLGDETLEQGVRERIDFSREALRVLWSRQFGNLRVYGGPTFNLRACPDEIEYKLTFQIGSEYDFRLWDQPFFVALDLQSLEQNSWQANITGQVGWYLDKTGKSRNRPRLFLEFFNGHSNMGQFWQEHESSIMFGIAANL